MNRFDETYISVLTVGVLAVPANAISNSQVIAGADIDADKLEHLHRKTSGQNSTMAAETRIIHVVRGATGVLRDFVVSLVTACTGDATATIDLKKNGTTCLSAPVGIDNGDAAYAKVSGTLSVTALAVGDVLTIVITVDAGTGALGTGLSCTLEWDEKAN